ncbi:MAG: NAD(+)/NADH kinase [Caldilineaceae bacterium SB0665_bin_21]|nr:NAD(+)/NADH kinase [Caldilineaceae bacterium SB0665_bin_21]MYA04056.1 NAD(+)/NADH kinase [Caldilineaceae bacterium SB0664_bin_22]MYC63325.1 NAD(+)/NADH kinase [Caldilineaceae bacterium SB0661_bin_34]
MFVMNDAFLDGRVATRSPFAAPWRNICVLHHPHKADAALLASEIGDWLTMQGLYEVCHSSSWEPDTLSPRLPHVDVIVAIGGDGTMLRAGRSGAAWGVPVLGINMGKVGFLSEVQPDQWRPAIEAMLAWNCWLEERLMISVRVDRKDPSTGGLQTVHTFAALNDAVISRGSLARVIETRIRLDGENLAAITCDGLIVATPTGSTGYALAAGGPILPPELRNIVIVPVAPHLSLNRPLVLSEGTEVRVRATWDYEAMLTVDGHFHLDMEEGDEVTVVASEHPARYVRTGSRQNFYQTLVGKLGTTY